MAITDDTIRAPQIGSGRRFIVRANAPRSEVLGLLTGGLGAAYVRLPGTIHDLCGLGYWLQSFQ